MIEVATLNQNAYGRKSTSDADDRQVLSIESQIDALKKIAKEKGLPLLPEQIFEESHSAKKPFTRPVFEELLNRIEKGQVQSILAWHPNRLSRNAVDSARLIQLMDDGKLIEIVTPSQTFRNTPQDKFLFLLMTGQAKMENDNKSIDVKRGLRKKNELGYPIGIAKPGYTNDYGKKGHRRVIIDPERFELVKQLLLMFLTGKYSVRSLLKYSDEVLGLKTIQRTKLGGKPLKLSRLYDMLKDPFYAGFFHGKNEDGVIVRYEAHESVPRMITEDQYWQIQKMLGRKGRPCPSVNKNTFPYVGRTLCGNCNGSVTAENKYQLICSGCKWKFAYQNKERCPKCELKMTDMTNPTYLHYTYYHCIKKRKPDCPERSVHEKDIDNSMISDLIKNFEVSASLSSWCIQSLDKLAIEDKKNEWERRASWERELTQKEKESASLVQMRMKNLISDEEFLKQKEEIEKDRTKIKEILGNMAGVNTERIQEIKQAFELLVGISKVFDSGTFEEKQEVLSQLGSNLTLIDKKISIQNKELFSVISKGLLKARAINKEFEPEKYEATKDKTEAFASVRPTLLPG